MKCNYETVKIRERKTLELLIKDRIGLRATCCESQSIRQSHYTDEFLPLNVSVRLNQGHTTTLGGALQIYMTAAEPNVYKMEGKLKQNELVIIQA